MGKRFVFVGVLLIGFGSLIFTAEDKGQKNLSRRGRVNSLPAKFCEKIMEENKDVEENMIVIKLPKGEDVKDRNFCPGVRRIALIGDNGTLYENSGLDRAQAVKVFGRSASPVRK